MTLLADPLGRSILACFVLIGGLVAERFLMTAGVRWYYRFGVVLPVELVPLPGVPEGTGRTRLVRWMSMTDGAVRFWAPPGAGSAPMLLHGLVRLAPVAGGMAMVVRFCPPFSLMLAPIWLVGMGIYLGEPQLTIPIALLMISGVSVLYWQFARRAAVELRWSFIQHLEK